MKKLAICTLALVLVACGDPEEKSGNNIAPANTFPNATTNNATTNNSTTNNATTNNATTNNSANTNTGYDAMAILAASGETNPADRPCQGDATLAFGGNVTNSQERYSYTADGKIAYRDTYEGSTHITREALRYDDDGELVELVTVDAQEELVELVATYAYDSDGRPASVEFAVPSMGGELSPAIETVEFNFESEIQWGVSTFDDNGDMISGESYFWDEGELQFEEYDEADALTALIFETAPPLTELHRFRFIEPFELSTKIASGYIDDDEDGMPESTITTTYDGDNLTLFEVDVMGGGSIEFEFIYTCN